MAETKIEEDSETVEFGQCRCCLSEDYCQDMTTEYLWTGQPETYYNVFVQCFNLFLRTNEELKMLICKHCVKRLRDALDFRNMVVQSELELLKIRNMDELHGEFCKEQSETVVVMHPLVQQAIKVELEGQEADDDSIDSYDEQDPLGSDGSFILPDYTTPRPPLRPPDDLVAGEAELLSRFPSGSLRPLPNNRKHFKAFSDWTYLRNLDKFRGKLVRATSLEKLVQHPKQLSDIAREKRAHAENISNLLNNSNATPFNTKTLGSFKFVCFYCRASYSRFESLRIHRREHVNVDAKRLVARESVAKLVVYAELTDLKCNICNTAVLGLDGLKKHLIKQHGKEFFEGYQDRLLPCRVVGDSYICQICEAKFISFFALERHITTVHRTYFQCQLCDAGFITLRRLKTHVRKKHDNVFKVLV